MDVSELFKPFDLGPLSLANRIVMAPMTRQRSPGGIPGPEVASYYARCLSSPAGLIGVFAVGSTWNHLGQPVRLGDCGPSDSLQIRPLSRGAEWQSPDLRSLTPG
ncbi:MAG: hypothetical protein JO303_17340 [Caulobacteraceae bacterium]|nr:hypothetical protein [Caulobacteraceae bacterium]